LKLHVIAVTFRKAIPLRGLIDSFILQTNPSWIIYIIHDGSAPQDVRDVVNSYDDSRIIFQETELIGEVGGHHNRKRGLDNIPSNSEDWVLMTNGDNYYVPKFVEYFLGNCNNTVGMVYCNTIHSHQEYNLHYSHLVECGIDMGAFIVRLDVAKETGFNHFHFSADGCYAAECKATCERKGLQIIYIDKFLFVHN